MKMVKKNKNKKWRDKSQISRSGNFEITLRKGSHMKDEKYSFLGKNQKLQFHVSCRVVVANYSVPIITLILLDVITFFFLVFKAIVQLQP